MFGAQKRPIHDCPSNSFTIPHRTGREFRSTHIRQKHPTSRFDAQGCKRLLSKVKAKDVGVSVLGRKQTLVLLLKYEITLARRQHAAEGCSSPNRVVWIRPGPTASHLIRRNLWGQMWGQNLGRHRKRNDVRCLRSRFGNLPLL